MVAHEYGYPKVIPVAAVSCHSHEAPAAPAREPEAQVVEMAGSQAVKRTVELQTKAAAA